MKTGLSLFLAILISSSAFSQCTNLFFSEYIEGTSNNKAFEIFNPTNNTIDLTDYVIYRNNNGSPTQQDSLFLEGSLASHAVYVAGNPSALASITAASDTLHTITFFNGDDALWIKQISTGDTLDAIGVMGVDPGVNWAVGTGATSEFTLIRKIGIQQGTNNWTSSVTQWDVYPQNMLDSIGAHTMTPCASCNSTYFTMTPTACNNYISPSNNYTWTSSGTYTDTIPNSAGCDSVITINLTINNSTFSSISPAACNNYTSPSNNYSWTSSGTYTDTIPNSAGCDSVITINLTINIVDVSVTNASPAISANAVGATYQWLDCNNNYSILSGATNQIFTAIANGSYAVEVTQNGCTDTSACELITNVGIMEDNFSNKIAAHPIPTNRNLSIDLGGLYKSILVIVKNELGQETLNKKYLDSKMIELTLEGKTGIYFVHLYADDSFAILKVIKE